MKVEYMNDGMYLLTCEDGQSLKITSAEFWEIARIAERIDAREEIKNYLDCLEEIVGVDSDVIRNSEVFINDVIDQLISDRIENESGDQIYDAISHCILYGPHKAEVCGKTVENAVKDANERFDGLQQGSKKTKDEIILD